MLANLLTVTEQVLVLFILMAVGYVCAKGGLIQQKSIASMNNVVLYAAIPCTLLSAFQLDLTEETLHELLIGLVCALLIYALGFLAAHLLVRDKDPYRKRLLTLGSILSNCNFMGFPLQTAVLGSSGVFYGSAYAAVSPLFTWTVGIIYLRGGLKQFDPKKALLNPGTIGTAAGLFLLCTGVALPPMLNQAVDYLGSLAVPLPMLAVGAQLAHTDLRRAIRTPVVWLAGLLRLVVIPLAALGAMVLCGIRGGVLVATIIAAATPPAVLTAMLDKPGSTLGAELVSLHTLCSIVTMPLIVSLAQTFA